MRVGSLLLLTHAATTFTLLAVLLALDWFYEPSMPSYAKCKSYPLLLWEDVIKLRRAIVSVNRKHRPGPHLLTECLAYSRLRAGIQAVTYSSSHSLSICSLQYSSTASSAPPYYYAAEAELSRQLLGWGFVCFHFKDEYSPL